MHATASDTGKLPAKPVCPSPEPPSAPRKDVERPAENAAAALAGHRLSMGQSPGDQAVYGRVFWLCYVANCLLMSSVAVLFRYSDFVQQLGGAEMQLGLVVGAGMLGALAMRFLQGVGIDQYGPGRVWRASLVLYTLAVIAHMFVQRVNGWEIYAARIAMTTGMAGAFGASLTYITLRAPQCRMAEMIGMLGTSGFLGIALGPTFSDWVFAGDQISREAVLRMFGWAAGLSATSLIFACFATWQRVHRHRRRRPPLLAILRRYHPGTVLLVGVGTGVGLGLPSSFLRAYAAELGISQIKSFFIVYAATAMVVRVGSRSLADRIGVRPVILWGLTVASIAMLSFLVVTDWRTLTLPAVLLGSAHALLFPATMVGGNTAFPIRYRGTATVLMLAMFDIGNLVGQPAAGGIVHGARCLGLPAYPAMFTAVAAFLSLTAAWYAWKSPPVLPGAGRN